jgi:hypothetical protein
MAYRLDFAHAISSVLYVMSGIMFVAGVVALFGLQRGLQKMPDDLDDEGTPAASPPLVPDPA